MRVKWFIGVLLSTFLALGAENPPAPPLQENFSQTHHSVTVQGKQVDYTATAGNLIIGNEQGKDTASIFFVSYVKEGPEPTNRPITFCFNGGPGSASLWLNIGALGPRVIDWKEGSSIVAPYAMMDNNDSLLDITDLVFIDPVSTGHSVAAPGVEAKQFYGVTEDIKSVAEFIRLFLSKYQRWDSPKYLAGESYGTTRAAGLSYYLQDEYKIYINGIILVSSILNFQTMQTSVGNDLPFLLYLPTYAATALYHKKISGDFTKTLREAEEFAMNDYALVLLRGTTLSAQDRHRIAKKLSSLTGLSPQYIELSDLRIDPYRFVKELLRDERKVLGRFDSRVTGVDLDPCRDVTSYDPSFSAALAVFTGTFNEYLLKELKWNNTAHYQVLAHIQPWNYNPSNNQYAFVVTDDLQRAMMLNPDLKIFVASGYYDLALPYFATLYTFNHIGLGQPFENKVSLHNYEGGHMMFLSKAVLAKLRADLGQFYK